ncbi:AraC family transcriptional regulator [Paenibacillus mucilaginosus]|uniref:Transcriptional regulator, AraC family n=1 Tax=Paenibacillus mucilaginosus (strain KNP414) TaxID=1036673 RepID=F8FHX0_PAEMK|nr:AraC family transcriptional regulator [Paenibacillus mucilaginosus]AEI43312.1 transcriptional regulator, AraC family [Paenibacillus mucilaginosus KNP414]MCG7212134.1 AraC family transcriptional regulator [Paenibacillus mucilaginosus]WDM24891.1 AraC family transcriptional regulator [Paenibacillus mucilaginosus]
MNPLSLKENRVHGRPMYPISVYHMECAPGGTVLECHWHSEFEFILVTKGRAVFQVGTGSFELTEGEAVFVHSGEIHAGDPVGEAGCSYSAVVFGAELLTGSMDLVQEKCVDPLLQRVCRLPVKITGAAEWGAEVIRLLGRMLESSAEETASQVLATKGLLLLIMAQLFSQGEAGEVPKAALWKTEQIKTALHYIHEHYQRTIRLKDLCLLTNMSEGHFCRVFRSVMQYSPIDYINKYRTQQAAKLLERTDKKIAAVAMDTGFENISYFTSVFKTHMGVTPSQFRKGTAGA